MIAITGATSGIGLEIAKIYSSRGEDLLLIGRNEEVLNDLQTSLRNNNIVEVVKLDLSTIEGINKLAERLEKCDNLEMLINNAGLGLSGEFVHLDTERHNQLINLNITALTTLMQAAAKPMLMFGSGKIVNISSILALTPSPSMSVYGASKAYVRSLSHAVDRELRGSGVSVHCVMPGTTKTKFFDRAGSSRADHPFSMTAEQVARETVAGLDSGKKEIVPGTGNKLVKIGTKIAPICLTSYIIYKALAD